MVRRYVVSTPLGRAQIELLPGHNYDPRHFLKLVHAGRTGQSTRARLVRSQYADKPVFVAKRALSTKNWDVESETRLARHVADFTPAGVRVEKPLAIVKRQPGFDEVVYEHAGEGHRKVWRSGELSDSQESKLAAFTAALARQGIRVKDPMVLAGPKDTIVVGDLEEWDVAADKAAALGLKKHRKAV